MPLPTTHRLFIDVKAGLAYPTFSSTSPVSNPSFYLGDLPKLEIFFIEQTGLGAYPRQEVTGLGTPGIKVALGEIDASPTSGHFTLSFGGNTSAALDYNVTAAKMDTELNKLNSIQSAGGVTVAKVGDNYAIKFVTNGNRGLLTGDPSALIPLSTVGISVLQEGDVIRPEIVLVHLQQTVAALATSFSAISASTATVSTLSAWNGSRAVYRVAISPDPKGGTFSLAFNAVSGVDVSSPSIAVGATALEVQNALDRDALAGKVTVQQVGAYAYDIAVTVEPDTGGLSANSAGLLSFSGFTGNIDLNTPNAISYLDGAESVETTLEVEIADGDAKQTVLQIPCILRSAVIDEASVQPLVLDTYLSQATADGRYLRQANNLNDVQSVSAARTNLDVYSKTETDTLIAAIPSGGSDEIKPYRFLVDIGTQTGMTASLIVGTGAGIFAQANLLSVRSPDAAITGYASAFYGLTNIQKGQGFTGAVDFSKQFNLSVNCKFQQTTDATDPNAVVRFYFGMTGISAFTTPITNGSGFGFIRRGGQTIRLLTKATQAGTLTEQDTGITPLPGVTYVIQIKSNGSGTAEVYINDVLVLTSTNAPYQFTASPPSYILGVEAGNLTAITGAKANISVSNLIVETIY